MRSMRHRERMAFWMTEIPGGEFAMGEAADEAEAGESGAGPLATLELSGVTATAQHVRRTPSLIAAAAEDYFLVSIQTDGAGALVQDGRTAVLAPGDFALYDST